MKPVFINGLGCYESGARVVLRELMRHFPRGRKAVLVMPSCNRSDITNSGPDVRIIALNHRLFGRWLRPVYELIVFTLGWFGAFSRMVNLSHYGWCPGGRYVLYLHNPLLVEDGHDAWSGQGGRPNWFKRACLHSCLRKAELVVVQTEHMAEKVRAYSRRRGITSVAMEVVQPLPNLARPARPAAKAHGFQFFYPASVFPHKRVELAVQAVIAANKIDPRVGLVVTVLPLPGLDAPCISYLGPVPYETVLAQYTSADALLFTSSYETLGLPLLEAMYFGLPAVLPPLDYARAVYAEAGVYYERESVEAAAEAILECVKKHVLLKEQTQLHQPHVWLARTNWADHWPKFGVKGASS